MWEKTGDPRGKTHHRRSGGAKSSNHILNINIGKVFNFSIIWFHIEKLLHETNSPSFFIWNGEILHVLLDHPGGQHLTAQLPLQLCQGLAHHCPVVITCQVGQEWHLHLAAAAQGVLELHEPTGEHCLWVWGPRQRLNQISVGCERNVKCNPYRYIPGFEDPVNLIGVQVP